MGGKRGRPRKESSALQDNSNDNERRASKRAKPTPCRVQIISSGIEHVLSDIDAHVPRGMQEENKRFFYNHCGTSVECIILEIGGSRKFLQDHALAPKTTKPRPEGTVRATTTKKIDSSSQYAVMMAEARTRANIVVDEMSSSQLGSSHSLLTAGQQQSKSKRKGKKKGPKPTEQLSRVVANMQHIHREEPDVSSLRSASANYNSIVDSAGSGSKFNRSAFSRPLSVLSYIESSETNSSRGIVSSNQNSLFVPRRMPLSTLQSNSQGQPNVRSIDVSGRKNEGKSQTQGVGTISAFEGQRSIVERAQVLVNDPLPPEPNTMEATPQSTWTLTLTGVAAEKLRGTSFESDMNKCENDKAVAEMLKQYDFYVLNNAHKPWLVPLPGEIKIHKNHPVYLKPQKYDDALAEALIYKSNYMSKGSWFARKLFEVTLTEEVMKNRSAYGRKQNEGVGVELLAAVQACALEKFPKDPPTKISTLFNIHADYLRKKDRRFLKIQPNLDKESSNPLSHACRYTQAHQAPLRSSEGCQDEMLSSEEASRAENHTWAQSEDQLNQVRMNEEDDFSDENYDAESSGSDSESQPDNTPHNVLSNYQTLDAGNPNTPKTMTSASPSSLSIFPLVNTDAGLQVGTRTIHDDVVPTSDQISNDQLNIGSTYSSPSISCPSNVGSVMTLNANSNSRLDISNSDLSSGYSKNSTQQTITNNIPYPNNKPGAAPYVNQPSIPLNGPILHPAVNDNPQHHNHYYQHYRDNFSDNQLYDHSQNLQNTYSVNSMLKNRENSNNGSLKHNSTFVNNEYVPNTAMPDMFFNFQMDLFKAWQKNSVSQISPSFASNQSSDKSQNSNFTVADSVSILSLL